MIQKCTFDKKWTQEYGSMQIVQKYEAQAELVLNNTINPIEQDNREDEIRGLNNINIVKSNHSTFENAINMLKHSILFNMHEAARLVYKSRLGKEWPIQLQAISEKFNQQKQDADKPRARNLFKSNF